MLQANEITQRFQHLQVTIDEAQRAARRRRTRLRKFAVASTGCRRNTGKRNP